jgi:Sec-independent protein translocase protein TatA
MRESKVVLTDEEVRSAMKDAGKTDRAIKTAMNKREKNRVEVQNHYDKKTSPRFDKSLARPNS